METWVWTIFTRIRSKSGTHAEKWGFGDLSCENLLSPQFPFWKDNMGRFENSSWKTERVETHVHDATALSPGPCVNELPHNFHSSQPLMSCCSLSIILTGDHLSRPGSQTMAMHQASVGSHRQENEHVKIICTKFLEGYFWQICDLAYAQCESDFNKKNTQGSALVLSC